MKINKHYDKIWNEIEREFAEKLAINPKFQTFFWVTDDNIKIRWLDSYYMKTPRLRRLRTYKTKEGAYKSFEKHFRDYYECGILYILMKFFAKTNSSHYAYRNGTGFYMPMPFLVRYSMREVATTYEKVLRFIFDSSSPLTYYYSYNILNGNNFDDKRREVIDITKESLYQAVEKHLRCFNCQENSMFINDFHDLECKKCKSVMNVKSFTLYC